MYILYYARDLFQVFPTAFALQPGDIAVREPVFSIWERVTMDSLVRALPRNTRQVYSCNDRRRSERKLSILCNGAGSNKRSELPVRGRLRSFRGVRSSRPGILACQCT